MEASLALAAGATVSAAIAAAGATTATVRASSAGIITRSTRAARPGNGVRHAWATGCARRGSVRVCILRYTAHNGLRRNAYVILPASYRRGERPLPLVVSPHGRGAHPGSQNAEFWGDLPALGRFAVVNPDGQGRRVCLSSWGYPGQVDDLARMPQAVERAYPWIRLDRKRVYAVGTSMGGQETLLLVARHPRLLAGAAAFDSVTDLALRYRQLPEMLCGPQCLRRWGRHVGLELQERMRAEVGGTPAEAPQAYAERSPLTYAGRIARSGVPLQIWWSRDDRVVTRQWTQSGRLARAIRALNPRAPLTECVGTWSHSAEMRGGVQLPRALRRLGLLP